MYDESCLPRIGSNIRLLLKLSKGRCRHFCSLDKNSQYQLRSNNCEDINKFF